jgi:hypothetical protein
MHRGSVQEYKMDMESSERGKNVEWTLTLECNLQQL